MKGFLISLSLFFVSLQFLIQTDVNQARIVEHSCPGGLCFSNYSGPGVNDKMRNHFINFANSASAFYKSDVQANIAYIKKEMDKLYGNKDLNFYVYIQTEENVTTNRYVWITDEYVVAEFDHINKINPRWSYFFVKNFATKDSPDYAYITNGSSGPGITEEIKEAIKKVINDSEPEEDSCSCERGSLANIFNTLMSTLKNDWNVVCDDVGATNGIVRTTKGLWGSFKFKKCYYTLFAD